MQEQEPDKLLVRIRIFHVSNDSSRIYFSFQTRDKDYFLLGDKSRFKASYRLCYEIFQTDGGKKTRVDSSNLKLVDLQNTPLHKTLNAYVDTKLENLHHYALKISLQNTNNNARFDHYIKFEKNNCTDAENIMITTLKGIPLLDRNFIQSDGTIVTRKGCDRPVELLRITGGTEFPAPPFGNDDFASKNHYTTSPFPVEGSNNTYNFYNLQKGVYLVGTGDNNGILFYHFNQWYPYCNDTSAFYEPLIFISTRDEYEQFKSGTASKQTFENFWIARAGNKEDARKAINEFYQRVFQANTDYASVQEGWRTDRGMVYIIFGKPGYVEKQMTREVWTYRTAFNTGLVFTFNKVDNPYSDNDFHLERDLRYKPQWYNAVDNWRRGKPFNLNGY